MYAAWGEGRRGEGRGEGGERDAQAGFKFVLLPQARRVLELQVFAITPSSEKVLKLRSLLKSSSKIIP